MQKTIVATAIDFYSSHPETLEIDIELPNQCPRCMVAYAEPPIATHYLDSENFIENNQPPMYALFFCPHCESCFMIEYSISEYLDSCRGIIVCSYPVSQKTTDFSAKIKCLSPQFVKIYHQAELAEASLLDEIAGLGYRKALEFLIKDYAIHEHPEHIEDIMVKPLAQCIRNYIKNDEIVTLAERSTWIGNDEAHYIRKQKNRDVSDMKTFIEAIVYFIGIILIKEDAASMTPKK